MGNQNLPSLGDATKTAKLADSNSPEKSENIVYHYCSLDTFLKIIETQAIRLTDIRKSNDSAELRWLRIILRDLFKSKTTLTTENDLNDFLEYLEGNSPVYTLCLSEDGDLLSQWRGYASDGHGVSIGFNRNILEGINNKSTPCNQLHAIGFSAIHYVSNGSDVLQALDCTLDGSSTKTTGQVLFESQEKRILVKNKAFREEKEWRLYVRDLNDNKLLAEIQSNPSFPSDKLLIENQNIQFYVSADKIVSYINLKLLQPHELIKRVYIGPKANVSRDDIERVFTSANIAKGSIEIIKSASTYQ